MAERSAGILLFRRTCSGPELLLVHPGGPFWKNRDLAAWSIPKGLCDEGEEPLGAAKREFYEETGLAPRGSFISLGTFKQPSGKQLMAWAVEGEFDVASFKSNTFSMEWPPKSGRLQDFPEADRAGWFKPAEAMRKVTRGQLPIVQALLAELDATGRSVDFTGAP
jgi:predicted NUDIX family NTP pyrophosphohydrolase